MLVRYCLLDSFSENLAKVDKESETNSEVQCLNCGSPVLGRFCQECGQASSTERYRFASLGRELYDQLRKIDASTTARTVFALLRDPGTFVRDYLSGKRVGFLGPIKYFFYSFVVQVLLGGIVFWLTHDRAFSSTSAIDLRFEIVSLISTVFWGLLWALFYRRSELNTVENVVAAIYFVAQVNFVAFFVQLIVFPFARFAAGLRDYLGLLDILITVGYSFYFARSLFSERLVLLVPKQLILTALYVVLLLITLFGDVMLRILTGSVGPAA